MATFTVNAGRLNPYPNFKFLIRWDGRVVAGVSKASGLKKTVEVIEHREGGDVSSVRRSPGQAKFEPLTLERGLTHDVEFERWANKVWFYGAQPGREVSLKDFRKDLVLEVLNEAGQTALAYKIYRAWVSEYTAVPELDANANAVAIESLVLQHEGFERDVDTTEPTPPQYDEPPG